MVTTRTIQPWLKWYPQDWRADPALQSCSLAARGLWIELIGFMHEAQPYGFLLIGGKQPSNAMIGRLVGVHHNTVTTLVTELVTKGVAGVVTDEVTGESLGGVIYSRRMLRDHEKALKNKENGAKGGNPLLTETVNHADKAKSPEARVQRLESREKEIEADASKPAPVKRQKPRPLIQIPDDFHLTTGRVKIAADMGLDAEVTFSAFRKWAVLSGKRVTDWDLRWLMWCEDQIKRVAKDVAIGAHRISHYGDDGLPRYVGDRDG